MANDVIQGDSFGTELPTTKVDEQALDDEKKMARYSKTAEYQRLKEFLENRVKFFQNYLPGGQRVQDVPAEERAAYWQAACVIVSELRNILDEYERAREAVEDAGREGA